MSLVAKPMLMFRLSSISAVVREWKYVHGPPGMLELPPTLLMRRVKWMEWVFRRVRRESVEEGERGREASAMNVWVCR